MIGKILDFIWPRDCEVCRRPVDRPGRHVCSGCLMRLPFESQKGCCRICGRHAEGFEGEYLCDRCAADPPWFDAAASALRFEEDARRMVIDFKFNNHLWLREDFTDWLEAAVSARLDVAAVDAVIPMPAVQRLQPVRCACEKSCEPYRPAVFAGSRAPLRIPQTPKRPRGGRAERKRKGHFPGGKSGSCLWAHAAGC